MQMCVMTGHRGIALRPGERGAGFREAWERFGRFRDLKRDPASPCHACDIQYLCDSCPGFAQLENGDEQGAVAWACRQAHLKAHALGIRHRCDIRHPYRDKSGG
jgi:hypothetical protein